MEPGRHPVSIGQSLRRALSSRNGEPPAKRTKLPNTQYHSLRYNFKPASVDTKKPGTLELRERPDQSPSVRVEHPGTTPGETFLFTGSEAPVKEFTCVLIYDEEQGTYTLEKLESYMILDTHERKHTTGESHAGPSREHRAAPFNSELDADGDFRMPETVNLPSPTREDNQDEEDIPLALPPRSIPAVKPPVKSGPIKPKKQVPKRDLRQADEEHLEFGRPPEIVPRPPPVAPPVESSRLELPGSSSSFVQPLPAPPKQPSSSRPPSNPVQDHPLSSDDEEWDEVVQPEPDDVEAEAEEIDVDAFESLLNEHLGEDEEEDFLAAAVSPEPETRMDDPPMSLRQMAGGGEDDEEDFSSSDESDDDE